MTNTVRKFELIDSRRFGLPADNGVNVTHLATIRWGKFREFVYFMIDSTGQTYIEEVVLRPSYTNGKLIAKYKYIDDDSLWNALAEFLKENGITDMKPPYYNPYKEKQ